MKKCPCCLKTKPYNEFYKSKASKDGCSGYCKPCAKVKTKKYAEANKDKVSERKARYQKDNKDRVNQYNKQWREANPEKFSSYLQSYRDKNPDKVAESVRKWQKANKEKVNLSSREYQKRNPDKIRALGAKKKAAKLNATPAWLSEDHLQEMKNTYSHAKECELLTGDSYHVDHIVPLQGKTVCGLHVPWNLQVLPAEVNLSKNNSYNDWEEYADSETGL